MFLLASKGMLTVKVFSNDYEVRACQRRADLGCFFLTAAVMLAITPGPGLFLCPHPQFEGWTPEQDCIEVVGPLSAASIHVVAAARRVSAAILAASALAFSIVKQS